MLTTHFQEILEFNREVINLVERKIPPFLFVGAGISMDSDLPSWNKFIENCVFRTFKSELSSQQLANLHGVEQNSIWLLEYSWNKFKEANPDVSQEEFFWRCLWGNSTLNKPSPIHYLIIRYAHIFNVPVFTTNYDDLLEEAAKNMEIPLKVYDGKTKFKGKNLNFSLTYIHGRIPRGEKKTKSAGTKKITPVTGFFSYYEEFNQNANRALKYFKECLQQRSCVFLGTSLQDHNINRVLYSLKDLSTEQKYFWFCSDNNDSKFIRDTHQSFWKLLKIQPVYCSSRNYSEITATLRRIISKKRFTAVDLKDHSLFYDLLNQTHSVMANSISFSKCVGAFDRYEVDFYIDVSKSEKKIEIERVWSSECKNITAFHKKSRRVFSVPGDLMSTQFAEFLDKEPISVERTIDELKPYLGLRVEGYPYTDDLGQSDFTSWSYLCFPIFTHKIDRAVGIWVLKFLNKSNKLKQELTNSDSLSATFNRDIVALGLVVKENYEGFF